MKLVNEKASIFETCVRFANNFLFLPDIDITFDDCPSPRFGTMDNAAESVLGLDGRGHILRCVAWECTSLAVQLPISRIQALNCIGGINNFSDRCGELEDRTDAIILHRVVDGINIEHWIYF